LGEEPSAVVNAGIIAMTPLRSFAAIILNPPSFQETDDSKLAQSCHSSENFPNTSTDGVVCICR
jgi:hypothetical protein